MNASKIIVLVLLPLILLSSNFVNSQTPSYNGDYTKDTANQCSSPTITLHIGGGPGEIYNVTPLSAPANTCVAISFENLDPALAHSFTINPITADNVSAFNIYAAAKGDTATVNFQTPNKAMAITFFCAVPGHAAAGMVGTLNIMSPSSQTQSSNTSSTTHSSIETISTSPGFETIPFLFVFIAFGLVRYSKKKYNK